MRRRLRLEKECLMKTVIYEKYGRPENLYVVEKPTPTPSENQVLIQIKAVAINSADWRCLMAEPFAVRFMGQGLLKPKTQTLGSDLAGEVVAVGQNVKNLSIGQRVFGSFADTGFGGLAEFICASEEQLAIIPDGISFSQAASTPMPAIAALQALRDKGQIKKGHQVLIYGGSGSVGTFAIQLAQAFGAEVTAVCSLKHFDNAITSGASRVMDYKTEDFTKSDVKYDLILGINGYVPINEYRDSLKDNGIYVMVGGQGKQILEGAVLGPMKSKKGNRKLTSLDSKSNKNDLEVVKQFLEEGKIYPIIDKEFFLSETAAAFKYYGDKKAKGKVVIMISSDKS